MMDRVNTILAVILAFSASPGFAQSAEPAPVDLISSADQLIMPNSGPRGGQTYTRDSVVFRAPILWRTGARLLQTVTITAGDQTRALSEGSLLQEAVLLDRSSNTRLDAFCTARKAAERKADKGALGVLLGGGSLWRGLIKGATDGQFCLIDADGDGLAERSVLVNAGTPQARTPVPIAPVRLQHMRMLPISPNDEVRIVLSDVSKEGKSANFRLDIIQQGSSRVFDTAGSTSHITRISAKKGLPVPQVIYGTSFLVTGIDGPRQTVAIQWPESVDRITPVVVDDGLKVIMRYGY